MSCLTEWRRFIRLFDIDGMFANEPLYHRAVSLYRDNVCRIHRTGKDRITASVVGRTGVYLLVLRRDGERLFFSCSCPSKYYPCKHAGALLYTLRDGPAGGRGDFSATAPGGLGVSPGGVSTYDPDTIRTEGEVHISTVRIASDPDRVGGSLEAPRNEAPRKNTAEDASYRPAFVCRGRYDGFGIPEFRLLVEPCLVYLRKNGTDGRIERYTPAKPRREGDAETEEILRAAEAETAEGVSILELLRYWRRRDADKKDGDISIPVELYLERCGRLERERPAHSRRILRITVDWEILCIEKGEIDVRPRVSVADRTGTVEPIEEDTVYAEHDGDVLAVANSATGSLWYLFGDDIPGGGFGSLRSAASLFFLPDRVDACEIRALTGTTSRLTDLVGINQPPETVGVVRTEPYPVLLLEGRPSGGTKGTLRYRYDDIETDRNDEGDLVPLQSDRAEELCANHGKKVGPCDAWFLRTDAVGERFIINELIGILSDSGVARIPGGIFDGKGTFTVEEDLLDFVTRRGDALLLAGFELKIGGNRVERPPGVPSVRVTPSDEKWLETEAGFETEEGFLAVEEFPARGLAAAKGRIYVLPPGSGTGELLERFHGRRIGRRDLVELREIEELLSEPDHPALAEYREIEQSLIGFSGIPEAPVPHGFTGTLRPYQRDGLSWLWFLHTRRLGGILADDMGLGKTVQFLALLVKAREEDRMERALVVCPVSTMGNWLKECGGFAPALRAVIHAGSDRAGRPEDLGSAEVYLISYATLVNDIRWLAEVPFDYLVLDEAQAVKNPRSKRRKAAAHIKADHRIALTGTPVENSIVELWSIVDLLVPGILGSRKSFSARYARGDSGRETLEAVLKPLILRRTKGAAAPDLPQKEEITLYAEAGGRQARVYEGLRGRFEAEVDFTIARKGLSGAGIKILEAMLRLRQAAVLPVLADSAYAGVPSAKIDLAVDRIIEAASEGHKCIVFSQFRGVLDEVKFRLADAELELFRLDGSIPLAGRDRAVAGFQECTGPACFCIGLKAGGLGINLTAADYVFLIDPWWNPAVESQAVDRAHRIGRTGKIIAYRLITAGTIEEKMLRLQERKRNLADSLLRADEGVFKGLTEEEVRALFRR